MSWGKSINIDMYSCNPNIIRSKEAIHEFVVRLADVLEVARFGEPQIVYFGRGKVEGYSLVQLIETSLISGHFANETNAVYIDIFSCNNYNEQKAIEFCKEFFKAEKVITKLTERI